MINQTKSPIRKLAQTNGQALNDGWLHGNKICFEMAFINKFVKSLTNTDSTYRYKLLFNYFGVGWMITDY